MMRFCTTCGRELRGDIRFCTGCGNQVPAAPAEDLPLSEPAQASQQPTLDAIASRDFPEQAPPRYSADAPERYTADAPSRYAADASTAYIDTPAGYTDTPAPYTDAPSGYPHAPSRYSGGPPTTDAPVLRGSHGMPPPRRRTGRLAVIAAIVAVIVAGGAAAGILLARGHHAAPVGLRSKAPGNHSTSATPQTSPPTTSPSLSPSPTTTLGTGQVRVAASLAGNPLVTPIAALLDKYFTAINNHDYQGYISLRSQQDQQGLTPAVFDNGYRSTKDSAELLVNILTANGTVAIVQFTSHQNPADSVNGQQSCTKWQISLFLQQNGSEYLIGKSPASYHSSHAACP